MKVTMPHANWQRFKTTYRRWLVRLVIVSTVVGLLLTIGTAWINVAWNRQWRVESDAVSSQTKPLWLMLTRDGSYFSWYWARAVQGESYEDAPTLARVAKVDFGFASAEPPVGSIRGVATITEAGGFPFLALYSERRFYFNSFDYSPTNFVTGDEIGIRVRRRSMNTGLIQDGAWNAGYVELLPLVPIAPGFLWNTLLYATLSSAFFCVLSVSRRALRIKRGLCPSCGYSLSGLPDHSCPECGWGREAVETVSEKGLT